jgi:hypothetical protein
MDRPNIMFRHDELLSRVSEWGHFQQFVWDAYARLDWNLAHGRLLPALLNAYGPLCDRWRLSGRLHTRLRNRRA